VFCFVEQTGFLCLMWVLMFVTTVFWNVVSTCYSQKILILLCVNGAAVENVKSLGYCQPHEVCSSDVAGV
jgi:hypothetical protein